MTPGRGRLWVLGGRETGNFVGGREWVIGGGKPRSKTTGGRFCWRGGGLVTWEEEISKRMGLRELALQGSETVVNLVCRSVPVSALVPEVFKTFLMLGKGVAIEYNQVQQSRREEYYVDERQGPEKAGRRAI
ncbi:hypothetical protein TIFTF001_010967 [Ficus carica]|uniref:Uncharacterized protein n=1 Tax=Ficus carica TaxID=3494 RepID=A0AA87ZZ27_FICCA|nr:hypothetical protein TIFTF001_010967 [Ficus carica]